ncbi:MAG: pyruvate kinase [Bacteroidetes bacterium]|jgi:pyruvate kinase|nr:pyruvate kinase [Bacteroidota bacterium]
MKKKTKIVATVSDLRCDVDFVQSLYDAGMNVVRLNTAHQSIEGTLQVIENVRKVSRKIPLLLDTKGPEIRTKGLENQLDVKKGDEILIGDNTSGIAGDNRFYVAHANFVNEVEIGARILVDDGDVEFEVLSKKEGYLITQARNAGTIKNKKSVNVPNGKFSLPALSEKDKEYINFAVEQDLDFIAHSFVRNKEDVLEIQNMLDAKGSQIKIIAKIENQEGVDKIDEILDYVYGVMVARGDLAIEVPYEKIPGVQRMIISKCIERRKPVIIATQMLHTMIRNPRPTRAEVSDVANAIYNDTDAIMLSGETAYGDYPLEAVQTMTKIALEVEANKKLFREDTPYTVLTTETSAYLAKSAVRASTRLDIKAIIAESHGGNTIRGVAAYRGKNPILAMVHDRRVVRELALSYGVYANYMEPRKTASEFVDHALRKLFESGQINKESLVVVLSGNFGIKHGASFIEITTVSNLLNRNLFQDSE